MIDRFGMKDAKPVSTPMAHYFKLTSSQSPSTDEEEKFMAKVPYASVVGSVMYFMVCTRPDLAHAVSLVGRFMGNTGKTHWEALKWILRYLKGTQTTCLIYKAGSRGDDPMIGYVDSDFAGSIDTRKSVTGYIFTLLGTAIR